MNYSFFGIDVFDYETQYDIEGKNYIDLIKTCCDYSYVVSFINMYDGNPIFDKLEPHRVYPDYRIFDHSVSYFSLRGTPPYKKFYRICPELCHLLIENANNIFDWCGKKPEDPTFFRGDGSVFFYCQAHDYKCILCPREGEDVSHIIGNIGWIAEDHLPKYAQGWFVGQQG